MTCLRSIPRSSSEGAIVPGGGSISVAPRVSATNTCSMDVSKAMRGDLRHPVVVADLVLAR